MKRACTLGVAMVLVLLAFSATEAALVDLYDWAFNIDGTIYAAPGAYSSPTSGQLPGSINTSLFQFSNGYGSGGGLGTITITLTGTGSHSVIAFFDHEIDEAANTYFNEYGLAVGTPAAGQSWEIDEPGYVFGDIYANVLAGTLDNTNGVPASSPDDVSMAMGWNFALTGTQTGSITLALSPNAPSGGFYLSQIDPGSNSSIYYSSSLQVGGGQPIPEPGTMLIAGTGLALLAGFRRRMKR